MPENTKGIPKEELKVLEIFMSLINKMELFLISWEEWHEKKSRGEEIDEKKIANAIKQLDRLTKNFNVRVGGFTKEQSEKIQNSTISLVALARSEHGDKVADELARKAKWCYEHLENYRWHRSKY